MVGAGDTWVALACGRHFINHGVSTVEPFSANSHRPGPTPELVKTWPHWAQWITDKVGLDTVKFWHPTGWVNQNWLTHTIFSWLAYDSPIADGKEWVFNSLVYWKFSIYILTVICVYYTGRVLGVTPALAAFFACAAMFISRSYLDIRPAGYSNLLVAAFILIVALATYRNYLYIWLVVPLTIFWANVHGGYIYVFIVFAPMIMLGLLTILSKRATVSIFSILTWLALFLFVFKSTNHDPFLPVAIASDKLLIFIVLLMIVSVVFLFMKQTIQPPLFYTYHIIVFGIVFLSLMSRLFPSDLPPMPPSMGEYVISSRISYFVAGIAAIGMGVIVTLFKDRLIAASPAALWHTFAAAAATFIAALLFNPFHLTNLTHTLEISISPHAEGWRNVHEWWAAFRWENPVGTAFPYMMMLIVGGGVVGLYVYSQWLMPKVFKGQRPELDRQQRRYEVLTKIMGFATAVLVCWSLMVSFSLSDVSPAAFLLCGLFVGILWTSVFVNVHFIYLVALLSVFALFTTEAKVGYLGRYIFPFIIVPCYALLFAISSQISKKPKYSMLNILYVLGGAVAALVAIVVLVNPFKFKPIWDVTQFVGLQRIWAPEYEANLDLAYAYLFPALYGINALCLIVWVYASPYVRILFVEYYNVIKSIITPYLRRIFKQKEEIGKAESVPYQLPRVDLALIVIAILTAYMAFRSRRFITIAAYVACPVIAMLIQQILRTTGATWNFYRRGQLTLPAVPRWLQRGIAAGAAVVIVGLGTVWGIKFKTVYLEPWPTEKKLSSVFIRMTASHAKPFYACEFIKENKLRGKMFNYWTEGGFIAWGQEPDPNGKTPLQLFMDGRAQAAYDYESYTLWSEIMFGGELVQRIKMMNREFSPEDYAQIGAWLNEKMKKYDVWVVLMPTNQFDTPFVKGLEYSPDWRLVYLDDKQKLYVDITTERGKEIFEGIENGATKYPAESYRDIIIAHNALVFSREPAVLTKALESAMKAYEDEPSRITIQMIQIFYDRYPLLKPRIDEFWKKVTDDFRTNKESILKEGGYHHRVVAALVGSEYLRMQAMRDNKKDVVQEYGKEAAELTEIMNSLREKTW